MVKFSKFCFLAPSSSPTSITVVSTTTTSITVNWMYDTSDADGYVVYYNGTAKLVEGDMKETTLNGLIPGTSYSITVRAYQDILGPPSTIYTTTENGKFECAHNVCIFICFNPIIADTSITAIPISMVTEMLNFQLNIQCQSDVLSDTLTIMVNSTTYNITPSLTFNATINQTGYDTSVQCIWSVNGGMFMNETTLHGKSCTSNVITELINS